MFLAFFMAATLLQAACSTAPQKAEEQQAVTAKTKTSVKDKTPFAKAQTALAQGRYSQAERILQSFEGQNLPQAQSIQYVLLKAELALKQNQLEQAEQYLSLVSLNLTQLSPAQSIHYGLLKAQLHEAYGQYLAGARERNFQSSLLGGEASQENNQKLWQDLMLISALELNEATEAYPESEFGAWLQLAAIARNSRLTLNEQLHYIDLWKANNPQHPAVLFQPNGISMLYEAAANRPKSLALLLPLSGSLEKSGQAIRDGFMAAYFDAKRKDNTVPSVHIYDEAAFSNINEVYAQAQFDGAQWLIGPVNKDQVQQISEYEKLPLLTLALNYSDRDKTDKLPDNLYQFGLAAEDEAIQIANQAWADGKRHALVLLPQGEWGKRIFYAFEKHWLSLGGSISEERFYPTRKDYNPDVRALLNVDDSQARYQQVRRALRQNTEFEPRRREDSDWVFMVALPQQARQMKPTFAFNFAADLPIYATSHVYSAEVNVAKDRDLNGVLFCDQPWVLQNSQLYSEVEKALPEGQGRYARLYAMGVDAFRLMPHIKQLSISPENQVFANTGALHIDENRRVIRRTQCTSFKHGRPQS